MSSGKMGHEEVETLLGVYALDALPAEEAQQVERHLESCPKCRLELQTHRDTAALMGNAGGQAPEGLWDRIAGALQGETPQLDLTRFPRPNRRSGRLITPRVAGALLAAAAAVMAVLGVELSSLNSNVNQLQTALPSSQLSQQVATALADPQAQRADLASTQSRRTAEAVVLPDGRGYLVGNHLPHLGAGHTYQLWGVVGRSKVSLGLLGPSPSDVAFSVGPHTPVSALAITDELSGGVVASHNPAVVSGSLVGES